MSQVISIPENLYERLKKHAHGFDTPANVIEKILNYYERHCEESTEISQEQPEQSIKDALHYNMNITK
jgi:predicted CopG family antitoxin